MWRLCASRDVASLLVKMQFGHLRQCAADLCRWQGYPLLQRSRSCHGIFQGASQSGDLHQQPAPGSLTPVHRR